MLAISDCDDEDRRVTHLGDGGDLDASAVGLLVVEARQVCFRLYCNVGYMFTVVRSHS